MRAIAKLGFLLALAGGAHAQIKLTSGGNATLTGDVGGAVAPQSAANAALATGVNFGEVGTANPNAYVCFTQPIFIRAFAASSVKVAVTSATFGSSAAAMKKSDIGIGIVNLAAGGPNSDVTLSNTTITPAFASDPCTAPKNVDGVPSFSATLNSLGTVLPGTTVMQSTGAISLRGGLNSNSNKALFDVKMAIAPQFYEAGAFSTTLTITITSP
jgi:hypothetical protein